MKSWLTKTLSLSLRDGVSLMCIALIGLYAISLAAHLSQAPIEKAQQRYLETLLQELIDSSAYDNQPTEDWIVIEDALGRDAARAYRARRDGQPVAIWLQVRTEAGYGGAIDLIVAIYHADASLAGVRVIAHRETPGLGDKITPARDPWIHSLKGKSLSNTSDWRLRRAGGEIDQITGATISTHAVVQAVKRALNYYQNNQRALFDTLPTEHIRSTP